MDRRHPEKRIQLRCSWRDEDDAELRNEGDALLADIHSAFNVPAEAITLPSDDGLDALERELEEEEENIREMRWKMHELRSEKGLLKPSDYAAAGRIPPHPDDRIPFLYGDTLQIKGGAPTFGIAASASGQYVAVASWRRVMLCEESSDGIGFRVVDEYRPPSPAISALCFADDGVDSSALVLATRDFCIGWDPLSSESLPETPFHEGQEAGSKASQQLWMRFRAGSDIVALSMGRNTWRELLLLGTEAKCLELYDVSSTVTLQHRISADGNILAISLTGRGSMAWALCTGPNNDANMLCAWQVTPQRVYGRAMYWKTARQGKYSAIAGSLSNCLAHSEAQQLLALGLCSGDVHIMRTNKLGAAVAILKTLPDALRATGSSSEGRWWEDREPTVAFCGETPLLAVGSLAWVVLVYQYNAANNCQLELVARLKMFSPASNSYALAWAPKLGALWIGYDHEIQFWLRDAVNFCPNCQVDTCLPEPVTGICPACGSFVSMKDVWSYGTEFVSAPKSPPENAADDLSPTPQVDGDHIATLAELAKPDDRPAEHLDDLSEEESADEEDVQLGRSLLFSDE